VKGVASSPDLSEVTTAPPEVLNAFEAGLNREYLIFCRSSGYTYRIMVNCRKASGIYKSNEATPMITLRKVSE
jgi:hypothetical protein